MTKKDWYFCQEPQEEVDDEKTEDEEGHPVKPVGPPTNP